MPPFIYLVRRSGIYLLEHPCQYWYGALRREHASKKGSTNGERILSRSPGRVSLLPAPLVDGAQQERAERVIEKREQKGHARAKREVKRADAVHGDAAYRDRERAGRAGDDIRNAHVPAAGGLWNDVR